MKSVKTLKDFLADCGATSSDASAIAVATNCLADAAAKVAAEIANGETSGRLNDSRSTNVQGEVQKHLDHLAHETFLDAARKAPVAWLLSEEEDQAVALNEGALLALAMDPLDGSSNIGINAPLGTIFGIFQAHPDGAKKSFLRKGRDMLAAGYFIYGPKTELVLGLANSTELFALDGARKEWVHQKTVRVPVSAAEFAINLSNYRHWDDGVRQFVDQCLEGRTGPFGEDYNTRWLAALVGEAHRILSRGGIFFYPRDARPGYECGRLRYLYECAPIAFLMEKAGAVASDGAHNILDLAPHEFHQRSPLCFGSPKQMELFSQAHSNTKDAQSPLFSRRGLFSAQA